MTRKKLARRDELARDHHLGNLELQRTVMSFKRWVLITGGCMVGFYAILAVIAVLTLPHATTARPETDSIGLLLGEMLAAILILCVPGFSFVYLTNNRRVALYTRGMVYLGVTSERVALWKDISWIQTVKGLRGSSYRVIHLSDGTRIRLTNLPTRESASLDRLEKFIQEKRGF
jgi:hypothetical protein